MGGEATPRDGGSVYREPVVHRFSQGSGLAISGAAAACSLTATSHSLGPHSHAS